MKLIILEGADNTGKSTLAGGLATHFTANNKSVIVTHFRAPHGDNPEECARKILEFEIGAARQLRQMAKTGKLDVVILDRSWYSEYVYGQIYRERSGDDILRKDIRECEDIIINNIDEAYLILCNCQNPDALTKHEDGLSLSKCDPNKLKTEIGLFDEIFDYAGLPYAMKVDVFDESGEFRNLTDILNEVLNYIYSDKDE